MKQIYVCSALRGDIQENIEKACNYCEYVVRKCGAIPIAPHIYFTQFLNDDIPSDRIFGLQAGLQLLEECDELWCIGEKVTQGMELEIVAAKKLGIPVRYFSDEEIRIKCEIDNGGFEYVKI